MMTKNQHIPAVLAKQTVQRVRLANVPLFVIVASQDAGKVKACGGGIDQDQILSSERL